MKILEDIPKTIQLNNPKFEQAKRVHDWRNHVPCDFKKVWENFTEREKKIIYFMAKDLADNEVWG